MSLHLLIDGDVLVYESSFACQKTRYRVAVLDKTFDNNKAYEEELKATPLYEELVAEHGKREGLKLMKERCPAEKVLDMLPINLLHQIAGNKVRDIVNACKADTYDIVLSPDTNFRHEVATIKPYKGHRTQEKPVYFEDAKAWFHDHPNTVVAADMLEADDHLGITMTQHPGCAIATIDKDLRMIPGLHYEWNKQAKFNVSQELAFSWFLRQMLMGDTADNIPGIDGIGEVLAKDVVDGKPHKDVARAIEDYYFTQYGADWEEAINEVAKLLWILRHPDQRHDKDLWFTLRTAL